MNYEIGVYGDSIAYGYGNENISWFDMLSNRKKGIKHAQTGEKIVDVLRKIREDKNHYQTLIIAVGINDLLHPVDCSDTESMSMLLDKYKKILEIAHLKTNKIFIQSLLPVREKLFPKQDWLENEMSVSNNEIAMFNQNLLKLAEDYAGFYLDALNKFASLSLSENYMDAVHLNSLGQQNLFRIYQTVCM